MLSTARLCDMCACHVGLDARAAAIVMKSVKNTVRTGRTVVCTIHQPSLEIFQACIRCPYRCLHCKWQSTPYIGPISWACVAHELCCSFLCLRHLWHWQYLHFLASLLAEFHRHFVSAWCTQHQMEPQHKLSCAVAMSSICTWQVQKVRMKWNRQPLHPHLISMCDDTVLLQRGGCHWSA